MPSRRLISTSTASAPNGTPERQGYTYRGTKREPADPAAVSERTRRDEGKQRAGAALRAARKAAGLSIRQAAGAAQVSAGYISAIETGHDWPAKRVIAALAAAYGVTPKSLASAAESTPVAPGKPDEARPVPRAGRADSGPAQPAREAPALARPRTPGTAVEAAGNSPPRAVPGSTRAERQAEQLAAIRKARADHAKAKRNRRGKRPAKPITGIRIPPPDGAA